MTTITKTLGWTKQCNRCDQTKDASEFYEKLSYVDGRDRTCKLCRLAKMKDSRLRKKDTANAGSTPTPTLEAISGWVASVAGKEPLPKRTKMPASYDTGVDRFCACGCGTKLTPQQRTFCCNEHRYPSREVAEAAKAAKPPPAPKLAPSAADIAKSALVAVSTPSPRIINQLRQLDRSEIRFLSPDLRRFAEQAGIIPTGDGIR